MNKESFFYYLIRIVCFPLAYLPYRVLHFLGRGLGTIGFFTMKEYRKRALSNLALAEDLHLDKKLFFRYAKKSFQNLAINCLEYPKFAKDRHLSKTIICQNPEVAKEIYSRGKGLIFFCGHQSNWETLFLDGTSRMKGVAIGKPIKNKKLYQWILRCREKNGGKIVLPKNAVKEGLKILKQGGFLGIVGDQGMPDSGYCFPFLGRRAWTSPAPALLSYKTNSPVIFASTKRKKGKYWIHYSDPIWPDLSTPLEEEVPRIMDQLLTLLQESIKESPGEWLWQHNRWKQQTIHSLYRRFRQDCICIILPKKGLENLLPHLKTLKEIYPLTFLTLLVPKACKHLPLIPADETLYYSALEETLLEDYRFKLIFNFTDFSKIARHYLRLSAVEVLTPKIIEKLADEHRKDTHDFSDLLKRALCKPGILWKKEEQNAL